MTEQYKTVYEGGEGELVEKKSRFIATVRPVKTEEEANQFVEEMRKKYWDARHNCSAFVIGDRQEISRCSDDGEPAQTAGRPMLDVLLKEEIHNVCVVVTRYFGGTLLGTGGLVRAYQKATQTGLENSVIIDKQIARKLTERKILTPAAYYASKGRTTNVTKKGSPYAWDSSTIADIMDRWREYLGHTVNFKTRKKSYKSKKTLHNPESEWKIFENTHEAIWTEAIADAARLARQSRRRPTKMGEMGMFSGMMFCADCGSIMYQCRATNFRRDQEYYLCSGYRKSRDVCGQTHSIRTVILEELVLQNLREIVSFASQRKDDFVKMVMDADMRQRNRGLAKRQKTLADAEKRITELDTIFKRLYEDTISGKLSDERFQKLSADYEKEQHQLQEVAAVLRGEIEAEEQKSANVERFLSVVERYTEIPELTPCILHEFVEKIVVHAASDPKGKNRTQEIDIYYKGIGALEVSKVTSSRQE